MCDFACESGALLIAEVAAKLPDLIKEEIEGIRAMTVAEITINRVKKREPDMPRGQRVLTDEECAEFRDLDADPWILIVKMAPSICAPPRMRRP